MSLNAISYAAPLRHSTQDKALDYELYEAAVALYDEGHPLDGVHKVLAHLLPHLPPADLTKAPVSFTQGSSRVTVRLEGDDLVASVPLVRLSPTGNAVAALRHVLTRLSNTSQLYQPRLRGDDVVLEFRDRLARLHPAKLVEVLRRMPSEADNNDDFLIHQFQALPLDRADVVPLEPADLARAEEIWRTHWNEVEELVKECQRKRSMFFLNELTAFAINRISVALPLTGFVLARFWESAGTFNDTDEDPMKRETVLGKCIKEMKAVPTKDLAESLGHAEFMLGRLPPGREAVIENNIGPGEYMEKVEQLRTSGHSMDAALGLVGTYYFLLARWSWPEEIEKDLLAGLESVGGKPWRDTAAALAQHAKETAEKYESDEEEEDEEEETEEGAS